MPRHAHARLCALALSLSACGGLTRPTSQPEVVELEGVMIEAGLGPDGRPIFKSYDPKGLYEEATDAFNRHDFEACQRLYGLLVDRFSASLYAHVSRYNRGLCLEQLKRHREAAATFEAHAKEATEDKDRLDGEFRWGFNLVADGQSQAAIAHYTRLLKVAALGEADRGEARLRRATAYINLKQLGEAEVDLKKAIQHVKVAYGTHMLRGNALYAEAHFRRGEIYQIMTRGVRLKLPADRMGKDLRDKTRFFRQAQRSFIDALSVQESYWATASGMKLGEIYEAFYEDVINAEVPPDFGELEQRFYLVELKKKLRPILEESMMIYEKNITMSQRIGADNEWVEETERRLVRLRGMIEEAEREAAEIEAQEARDRALIEAADAKKKAGRS
ncbi:tetratricopeptide repeat protein [Myxococcota bacterium]|nr:tetratricopeptide repeat protein [Myxococcota bacterium]MBU1431102.1 tetratricopeptide repeat protein [Myxococcota bacterium]MBU1899897.1 tetratricopeptide repeat protein [Myxococcota bacterium]